MMLGIVIHVGMVFLPGDWGGWSDYPETWESHGVRWSISFVHIFRMPAFFLLAGFFAALLWERYGMRKMLDNRFERIVLPFGVFVFALPPAIEAGFTFMNTAGDGNGSPWTLAYEAAEGKSFWPEDTMHLWFLYDLIFIVSLGALVVVGLQKLKISGTWLLGFVRRTVESPWRSLLVFGLANALWWFPLRWEGIPTNTSWATFYEAFDVLGYYFVIYGIGWMVFAARTDVESLQLRAWSLTILGLVSSVAFYGAHFWLEGFEEQPGVMPPTEIIVAFSIRVLCGSIALVALSRGLAGLFMRYAGSGSPRWRYVSDSSYWVYLVHLPLGGFVCAFVAELPLPVWIQFPMAMAGVAWLSFLTYDVGVRTTFLGRFLNGRKYPAAGRKLSAATLVFTLGCLVAFPFGGTGGGERSSPWRDGGVPAELLADEEVLDPLHETPPVLPDVDLSRCIGVRNYAICPDGEPYKDAIAACVALGGTLASFETEEENTEVVELVHLLLSEPLRVGVSDEAEDGRWMWLSGVELDYEPWDEGQPDNHGGKESCVGINFFGERTWHDVPCDYDIGFVCELPVAEAESSEPGQDGLE
jgi:hypothetical protein